MNIPANLLYTKEHEWIRVEGEVAVVGITDYAQGELGEIVYVEVETLDETLDAEAEFGAIEAVKTTSDLFMPVSGTVVAFNEALEEKPELVNEDPYGEGWIIKIQLSDPSQLEDLLSNADYEAEIG